MKFLEDLVGRWLSGSRVVLQRMSDVEVVELCDQFIAFGGLDAFVCVFMVRQRPHKPPGCALLHDKLSLM